MSFLLLLVKSDEMNSFDSFEHSELREEQGRTRQGGGYGRPGWDPSTYRSDTSGHCPVNVRVTSFHSWVHDGHR